MKKQSAMGGGEFEYSPQNLEKKINKRIDFLDQKEKELNDFLNQTALEYSKSGLGDFENCKKELLRRIILDMRGEKNNESRL